MDQWSIGAKKLASGQLSTDPEILHLASEPSFDVSNARLPDCQIARCHFERIALKLPFVKKLFISSLSKKTRRVFLIENDDRVSTVVVAFFQMSLL